MVYRDVCQLTVEELVENLTRRPQPPSSWTLNSRSEPTTASVSGDSNPFFNVSLPNQRSIQDIDVNKAVEVNHHDQDQEDEDRPNFMEMVSLNLADVAAQW